MATVITAVFQPTSGRSDDGFHPLSLPALTSPVHSELSLCTRSPPPPPPPPSRRQPLTNRLASKTYFLPPHTY
jgi:hypothetical protein